MRTALVALIGTLITGCVFVSMMAMANIVEDPPPTTFGAESIVVPPPLEPPAGKPRLSMVCTNIGNLGFEAAVEAMVASSVALGGSAERAEHDIMGGIIIDCPEYEEQMRAR